MWHLKTQTFQKAYFTNLMAVLVIVTGSTIQCQLSASVEVNSLMSHCYLVADFLSQDSKHLHRAKDPLNAQ